MKIRHVVILIIFILINVSVIMTLNFSGGKEEEKNEVEETFISTLSAIEITNQSETFNVVGFGTLSSYNSVDVSSEVQGKLLKGNKDLKPGVKFKKGDLLFKINNTEARYNIRSRKSGFINIIAQLLPDMKVDFPSEYEKWNNYISSIKLNESIPTLPAWKSPKEKIFLSTRNVLTEYFAIKSLEEQLKKYLVYAPFSGMITDVFISDYSVVNPGAKIIKIMQTGNFEIPVSIPVSQLSNIEIGTKCQIYSTSGDLRGSGSVVRVSEVINKNTQSVDVYIKPDQNVDSKFIAGEYVRVEINESSNYKGCRIPLTAVMGNEVFVYSKKDSVLQKKEVVVLNENEKGVFITGLRNKEVVIVQEVLHYTDSTKYDVLVK
jgi:multidrug efflux pump subunit AcrA (membrane-fusion protein)